ncbi:lysosome membrane 2, partial [Paramuricea clavata]
MQYFMFNLTNPSDVQNGSKPSVNQLGPYSYREIRHNVPRYFNHSIDTVAYYSEKAYVFDRATSCADCDPTVDKVYTINILLLKISQLLGKGLNLLPPPYRPIIQPMINSFLKHEKVFPARSVHELLWGYEDYILLFIDNFTMALNEQLYEKGFKFNVSLINPVVKLQ